MLIIPCFYSSFSQIVTLRLSYKLVWPEARLVVNESADWGEEGEINISPDNIVVIINCFRLHFIKLLLKDPIINWNICLKVIFTSAYLDPGCHHSWLGQVQQTWDTEPGNRVVLFVGNSTLDSIIMLNLALNFNT